MPASQRGRQFPFSLFMWQLYLNPLSGTAVITDVHFRRCLFFFFQYTQQNPFHEGMFMRAQIFFPNANKLPFVQHLHTVIRTDDALSKDTVCTSQSDQSSFLASGHFQDPNCCPGQLPANGGAIAGQQRRWKAHKEVGPIAQSIRLRARSHITLLFFLISLTARFGALAPERVIKTRRKSHTRYCSLLLVGGGVKTISEKKVFLSLPTVLIQIRVLFVKQVFLYAKQRDVLK